MRNMIIAVLAVALSSGVAAADHYRGGVVVHERGRPVVVEHRAVVRGPVVHERVVVGGGARVVGPRVVYHNPRMLPPAMRVEHYRPLHGYSWAPGYYSWVGG